ncbi:MAG: AMP-binding protein, partial [Trichodesmium sp. St17_bin3_1_1]|nr:AMP-binding protein [Trichodesmium sp. St17_bin3_1_1]
MNKLSSYEDFGLDVPAFSNGGILSLPEDAPQTLVEALQRAAQKDSKQGIVYINSDGSENSQSYQDLLLDAQKILAGLRKIGLKPQDKIILLLECNQDFLVAFWGCILGGFVPVPVSVALTWQSKNTISKLQNVWQMLGRPLILTDAKLAPSVREWSQPLHLGKFAVETLEELRGFEP